MLIGLDIMRHRFSRDNTAETFLDSMEELVAGRCP